MSLSETSSRMCTSFMSRYGRIERRYSHRVGIVTLLVALYFLNSRLTRHSLNLSFMFYFQKFSMNPFYRYDTPIRSPDFENRIRALARRYF